MRPPILGKISLAKVSGKTLRENILFWGIIILFLFLVFFILWSDYVYYKVNFKESGSPLARPSGRILVSNDIEEVINLLDQRAAALQNVLQSGKRK